LQTQRRYLSLGELFSFAKAHFVTRKEVKSSFSLEAIRKSSIRDHLAQGKHCLGWNEGSYKPKKKPVAQGQPASLIDAMEYVPARR